MGNSFLILPDTHEPFGLPGGPKFALAVAKEFKVPKSNIIHLGDEIDQYHAGRWPKDPDAKHTATSELETAKECMQAWYRAFPEVRVCTSNHGLRWARKAFDAEIPSQMLRAYQEVIAAPKGWRWADSWLIATKHRWRATHGTSYGGPQGHRNAAMDAGISTVIGHLHSHAGVCHLKTQEMGIWAMNSGCLIDVQAYAFAYGKDSRFKPTLGCSVVIDDGRTPIFIPWERF